MSTLEQIEKSKTGEEFLKQIALGYRAGVRLRVRDYRRYLIEGQAERALESIKLAINNPSFFKSQKDTFIKNYGREYLIECMSAYNVVPLEDSTSLLLAIETDMDYMVNYSLDIVTGYNNGVYTYEDIALKIEVEVEYAPAKWQFPIDFNTAVW